MNDVRVWLVLAALISISTAVAGPQLVSAQAGDPPEDTEATAEPTEVPAQVRTVTFEELGQLEEVAINGAGGNYVISFEMPHGWKPTTGTTLDLNLRYVWVGADREPGVLQVRLNSRTIGTINLLDLPRSGNVVLEVPVEAWTLQPDVLEHRLSFQALTAETCNEVTEITIAPESQLTLNYELDAAPPVALDDFPRPFYQNTFEKTPILFVVSGQASAEEMQAASAVAAHLGYWGALAAQMSVITPDEFDPEVHGGANVVLIGTPDSNPLISAAAVGDLGSLNRGNGLVSVQNSQWHPQRAVLVVTGANAEGITAASTTLTMTAGAPALTGNSSTILSLAPYAARSVAPLAGTFRNFGYADVTRPMIGRSDLKFEFDLGEFAATEGYVDIHFAHSMPLDEKQSSLTVLINDVPVGSVALDATNASNGRIRVEVPTDNSWWRGNNVVKVRASLQPQQSLDCATTVIDPNNIPWVTVFDTSSIYVEGLSGSSRRFELSSFPHPFEEGANLDNLVFVMPETQEAGALDALVKVSARIGQLTTVERYNQKIVLGNVDGVDTGAVLIVIGRPSANPYLMSINGTLAQPFEQGSDLLAQASNPAAFQMQAGQDYGVVQISSWESGAQVPTLVISGTSDERVREAAAFMADPEMAENLFGNVLYVYGTKFRTYETRSPEADSNFVPQPGPSSKPDEEPIGGQSQVGRQTVPLAVDPNAPNNQAHPDWAIAAVAGTGGVLLLVLLVIGWYTSRRNLQKDDI